MKKFLLFFLMFSSTTNLMPILRGAEEAEAFPCEEITKTISLLELLGFHSSHAALVNILPLLRSFIVTVVSVEDPLALTPEIAKALKMIQQEQNQNRKVLNKRIKNQLQKNPFNRPKKICNGPVFKQNHR